MHYALTNLDGKTRSKSHVVGLAAGHILLPKQHTTTHSGAQNRVHFEIEIDRSTVLCTTVSFYAPMPPNYHSSCAASWKEKGV